MTLNLEIGIGRHFSEYLLLERVLGREAVTILHKENFQGTAREKTCFPNWKACEVCEVLELS